MANGIQLEGLQIKTVFHNPLLTWLKEISLGVLLGSAVMGDPRVDAVVRQDAHNRFGIEKVPTNPKALRSGSTRSLTESA